MVAGGDPRSLVTISVEASILGLIIIAAIVGNTLILASLYRFSCLQTKTNVFVLNLACADLLLAVLAMPFTMVSSITYNWIFGPFMCTVQAVLNSLFCEASIMTLLFVSLERFIAIVFPLKYETIMTPKTVKFIMGYTWFHALLCASSTFAFSRFVFLEFESICTVDWSYNFAYTLVFAMCFLYIPFIITAVLYCVILQAAIRQRKRVGVIKVGELVTDDNGCLNNNRAKITRNACRSEKKTLKERKATIIIAIVVGTFCVCWFPHSVGVFCILGPSCDWTDTFYVTTTWLAMLNSAMNPFIYGLMNQSFRRAFKSIFFCERDVGNADLMTNILQERKSYENTSGLPSFETKPIQK